MNLKVSLFCLLAESEIEHQSCTGESEWEGETDAGQAPVEDETEQIACRKGDDEVGNEGIEHYRLYI